MELIEHIHRLERWEELVEELRQGRYCGFTLDDYYNAVAHRSNLEPCDPSCFPDEFKMRLAKADAAFRSLTWVAPHTRLPGEYWFEFRVPIHPHPCHDLAADLKDEFGYEEK